MIAWSDLDTTSHLTLVHPHLLHPILFPYIMLYRHLLCIPITSLTQSIESMTAPEDTLASEAWYLSDLLISHPILGL